MSPPRSNPCALSQPLSVDPFVSRALVWSAMPNPHRHGSHTLSRLTVHLVWVTKYRYHVLKGDVQQRCRELIIQICNAEDLTILKGAVGIDHVHLHLEYPAKCAVSDIMKRL